jgi:uncharacterized protein (DUF302 family)
LSLSDVGGADGQGGTTSAAYDYRRECGRDFQEAVDAVEEAIGRHGFRVRLVHDLQATLAAKGFAIKPIRIYELDGTRDLVERLESATGVPATGGGIDRLLPCRVNIFVEGEVTVVTALRPTLMTRVFPESGLDEPACMLETELVGVVDEAASGDAA